MSEYELEIDDMNHGVPAWPDPGTKKIGDYVENVHPHNRGRYPLGIVENVWTIRRADGALMRNISVRTGPGSTVSGPAENWRRTDAVPGWIELAWMAA